MFSILIEKIEQYLGGAVGIFIFIHLFMAAKKRGISIKTTKESYMCRICLFQIHTKESINWIKKFNLKVLYRKGPEKRSRIIA